jgi:predicted transposase YdaD
MNAKGSASAAVGVKVIQLMEELLARRFHKLGREEIREICGLDLRKSSLWQEAAEEGREQGRAEGRAEGRQEKSVQLVQQWLAKGMPL